MASYHIETRKTKKGEIRYYCRVRVKKGDRTVHNESRTFSKKADAKSWGNALVAKLEAKGIPGRSKTPTLRELIITYLKDTDISAAIGRSKTFGLNMIADTNLAKFRVDHVKVSDIVSFCKDRKEAGAKPQTIACDISYIRSVLKAASPVFGFENVSDTVIRDSYYTLYQLNLIAKSDKRSRRPKHNEIKRIKSELRKRQEHPAAKIPFIDILDFSILSCMRIGEICKIEWRDVDEKKKAVKVRDRKDPRKKKGNHMWVPLLGDAWEILQRQPRVNDRIFPYNGKSISAGFQRVRNDLGIEDLRYHDLRREGASRLFEQGFSIEDVAQVTGHRSLNVLWQVYTELFPNRVHEKFELLQQQNSLLPQEPEL